MKVNCAGPQSCTIQQEIVTGSLVYRKDNLKELFFFFFVLVIKLSADILYKPTNESKLCRPAKLYNSARDSCWGRSMPHETTKHKRLPYLVVFSCETQFAAYCPNPSMKGIVQARKAIQFSKR